MAVQLSLPEPLPWQKEVLDSPARFKVICAGRRTGKTHLSTLVAFMTAFNGGSVWWVAPTYALSEVGFKIMNNLAQQLIRAEMKQYGKSQITLNRSKLLIDFGHGGFIQCKSADRPEYLIAESLDLVVIDEAATVKPDTWEEYIQPTLMDRQGKAIFISTPKGKNWFFHLFLKGNSNDTDPTNASDHNNSHSLEDQSEKDVSDPNWQSWQLPTTANPYIPESEIERMKRDASINTINEQIYATFVDSGGSVFRNLDKCLRATPQKEPIPGHSYVMGVDWGKQYDFTVITIIDTDLNEVVFIDRFNTIKYHVQRARLGKIYDTFKPYKVTVETNSIGITNLEQLQLEGIPAEGFTTTKTSKPRIIEKLQLAFEKETLQILNDPILVNELEAFQMKYTDNGHTAYSAPSGFHDDCVISLAIAWDSMTRPASCWGTFDRSVIGI